MVSDNFDFMYGFLDYDNDRAKVREKFLTEVQKRTSLLDIGETLDNLVYESKAANWRTYSLEEHYDTQPEKANKDFKSSDFFWSAKIFRKLDPKQPKFIDDPSLISQNNPSL